MKCLLIDNDKTVLTILSEYFQNKDFELIQKDYGFSGLYYLLNAKTLPNVIICSFLDPYFPNETFIRVLKSEPKFCPIHVVVLYEGDKPIIENKINVYAVPKSSLIEDLESLLVNGTIN